MIYFTVYIKKCNMEDYFNIKSFLCDNMLIFYC